MRSITCFASGTCFRSSFCQGICRHFNAFTVSCVTVLVCQLQICRPCLLFISVCSSLQLHILNSWAAPAYRSSLHNRHFTGLFSAHIPCVDETLQVFCLGSGQHAMKLPPNDPVHEAYRRLCAPLGYQCAKALVSCSTRLQVLPSFVTESQVPRFNHEVTFKPPCIR